MFTKLFYLGTNYVSGDIRSVRYWNKKSQFNLLKTFLSVHLNCGGNLPRQFGHPSLSVYNRPCYWASLWVWLIPGWNFLPSLPLSTPFSVRASTKCALQQRFAEIVGRQAFHHYLWWQSFSIFHLIATFLSSWKTSSYSTGQLWLSWDGC